MKKILSLLFIIGVTQAFSQSRTVYTAAYTNNVNGPGYFQPLTDVLASDLNTQMFVSRRDSTNRIKFNLGVLGVRSMVNASMKSHAATPLGIDYEGLVDAPTIFGNRDALHVEGDEGALASLPGGFEINILSLIIPQLGISNFINTDITLRYFAYDFEGRFGKFNYLGFGIQHQLGDYFKLADNHSLSIGYFYNDMKADDEIYNFKSHYIFTQYGYVQGIWQGFVQLGYLDAGSHILYESFEEQIDFSGKSNRRLKYGIGSNFDFGILDLQVQLDFMNPVAASIYLGLSI